MSRKCKSLGSYEQLNGDMYFILKQRAKRKEKKNKEKVIQRILETGVLNQH